MSGRPRKPTVLKLVAGTLRKSRTHEDEPQPDGDLDLLKAPDWMSKTQKAVWDRLIQKSPQGLLKELDEDVFTTMVVAVDLRMLANAELQKADSLLEETTNGNLVQSQYLSIINRQSEIIGKAASDLGFTPTSRTRIALRAGKKDSNPFAKHAAKPAAKG